MGIRYRLDITMLPDESPKTRQLVAAVYNQCKRGMRDPEGSFLRMSSTYDSTQWDEHDIPSVWNLEDHSLHDGGLYMLLSSDQAFSNGKADFCIYVIDDVPAPQAFPLSLDLIPRGFSHFIIQKNQQRKISGFQVD